MSETPEGGHLDKVCVRNPRRGAPIALESIRLDRKVAGLILTLGTVLCP